MAATLQIPETAQSLINSRWLARRIARSLWHIGLVSDRAEADRSLSRDGLPAVSIKVGDREFLINVEEL